MATKFGRDQLVLAVAAIFKGAARRIETAVPFGIPIPEFDARKTAIWDSIFSTLGTVRNQLVELSASLGRDVQNPDQCTKFQRLAEVYVNESRIKVTQKFPDVTWLAESFVDQYFTE